MAPKTPRRSITKRRRPRARLAPVKRRDRSSLADVKGWLNKNDPFFTIIEEILSTRHARRTPWPSLRIPGHTFSKASAHASTTSSGGRAARWRRAKLAAQDLATIGPREGEVIGRVSSLTSDDRAPLRRELLGAA